MPAQVTGEQELGVDGLADEPESRLVERAVALEQVAAEARRDHVGPGRLAAPRAWHHVVHGELVAAPAAVLAGVPVAAGGVFLFAGSPLAGVLSRSRGAGGR